MTTALRRVPVALRPDQLERVKRLLAEALPQFAGRQVLSIEEVEQPFFRGWRILEVISPMPMPDVRGYLAWQAPAGVMMVLSGRIQHLHDVALSDPPLGLDEDAVAERYAWNASGWTKEASLPDFRLSGPGEIPWNQELSAEEAAVAAEVKHLAIAPLRAERTEAGFELRYFLLNDRRLIERTLRVPVSGLLERKDVVLREGLPVPPGRLWHMIDGRPTPVG